MANRLTGMRLGRQERLLLESAGSTLGITPTLIDLEAPQSTQQGLLRAAMKLESAGLIERHPVYKERRARDLRRERPHFHAGRFWTYSDPSRRLYVRRVAILRTNFGEAILQEFLPELRLGRPIRWDDHRVARAEARARQHTPDYTMNRDRVEQQDDRFRERQLEEEEARDQRREYLPPAVRSREDQQRWLLAVGLARREKPNLGSERLLQAALELYGSALSSEELRARLGPRRRSPELIHNALGGWRLLQQPE